MEDRETTYREHPAYLLRECGAASRASVVGAPECAGMRWFHGPLCIERYTSDREPDLPRDGQGRLAVWQPVRGAARPAGWWPGLPRMSIGLTGYAPVGDDGEREKSWSSHARRHLSRWRRDGAWSVRAISAEEYLAAYARSTQDPILRLMFGAILKEKLRTHPGLVRLTGAAKDGAVQAGFVCVDVPETGESTHLMSFIVPAARDSSAAVGLMDDWFRSSRGLGLRWLDFGLFWQKGEPRSWKGFSRFKAQFGIRYLRYPTPFMRLFGGRDAARRLPRER